MSHHWNQEKQNRDRKYRNENRPRRRRRGQMDKSNTE